jgi:hypothetical protein
MAETVAIRLTGEGFERVGAQFGRLGRHMEGAEKRSRRLSGVLGRTARAGASALHGLAGAAAGVGVVVGGRAILNYQKELARLAIDAKMTAAEFPELKASITGAAAVGIQNDDAAAGLKIWQDFGGQLRVGMNLLSIIGKVSQSTGTDFASLNLLVATLTKNLGLTEDQALGALARLKQMGDAGNISLAMSAERLPQIIAAGRAQGFTGQRGVDQLFGAFQLAAGQFGSDPNAAARGTTAVSALIRDLTGKSRQIGRKLHIKVFESKDGKKQMRDLDVLMKEIITRVKGDAEKLRKIFSDEAFIGATAFMDAKTGGFAAGATQMLSGSTATIGDLEADFKRYEVLAREAQKAEVAIAKMRDKVTTFGLQIASFVADNPVQALAAAIGGKMVLGALAGSIGPQGALITGALGAGFALGRFADESLGLSDRLANVLFGGAEKTIASKAARESIAQQSQGAQQASLLDLAKQLTTLGLRGKTVETAPGVREQLTSDTALRLVQQRAEAMGSQDVFLKQVELLRQVVAALDRRPRGAGVDAPQNIAARGQAR